MGVSLAKKKCGFKYLWIHRNPSSASLQVICSIVPFYLLMMLYLSFPVAMFWISNQAEYFEEYVIKRKREIYPPEDEYVRKELEDFKERMRKMQEERLLKEAKD
ncbi:protein PET100 homolog, mitochondrial isoform X1 [Hemicordylus capensis]|uniref:protein PET100 homolog, mitochondrial isoform X1 n=1 Tax=Hemicordylus capensis TaxID=884348 RepID=UPI00230480CD|nr:protein PET100 homolog, mitochondrial isoform X1 [Hemicordylus capensis]